MEGNIEIYFTKNYSYLLCTFKHKTYSNSDFFFTVIYPWFMDLSIDDYWLGHVHRKDEESHQMLPLIQNTKKYS